MLLLVFLILIAIILFILMSKSFYLYSKRSDANIVGKVSLVSGIGYLILALASIIGAAVMIKNNHVQYTVQFNKMVKI